MLLDWKSPYYQNDSTTQGNLQIQGNPYQSTKGTDLEQNILKFGSTKDPEQPKTFWKRKMELEESGSRTSAYTTKQQSSKPYGTGTKTEL